MLLDLSDHRHPSPLTLGPPTRILTMEMLQATTKIIILTTAIAATILVLVSVDPQQPHILPQANALNRHQPIHFRAHLQIG
jgi:hypothetical protein